MDEGTMVPRERITVRVNRVGLANELHRWSTCTCPPCSRYPTTKRERRKEGGLNTKGVLPHKYKKYTSAPDLVRLLRG